MSDQLTDEVLGQITVKRYANSRAVKFRVAPNGTLQVSAPRRTSLSKIKRIIASARHEIKDMVLRETPKINLSSGDSIGKSHHLIVQNGQRTEVSRHGLQIKVVLQSGDKLEDPHVQAELRKQVIAALRREAKSYLPKRLAYLASQLGLNYQRVRFTHAGSRWGSCSTSGTISLNIALMKLPFELIDYVLIHELAHTEQMNHSHDFWEIVAEHDPGYKEHRQRIKQESPSV